MGTIANEGLEKQGCHPFYESVLSDPFVTEVRTVRPRTQSQLSCCFGHFSINKN